MTTEHRQFNRAADAVTNDSDYRRWMQSALDGYRITRNGAEARFADWQQARRVASAIKWDALEHLDGYLEQFVTSLKERGTKVCWAADAAEARQYILRVVREQQAKSIVKSKCMTSEEIHLNELLEDEGFEVVESDLGEFIVQLRKEPPYHFVFPAMHLKRDVISRLFHDKLDSAETNDPEELTNIARRVLRQKYVEADIGFTGANFGIAETGMISITENEGNARLTTSLPRVHIALLGIEKVLPKLEDLALFLPMLATTGTGQALTGYNSLFAGPRQEDEPDGPEEFHVVLLDNRRSHLLADPARRDALRCIRCGACLNVCPIFKNVGGHTYGTTYQGPIGSVITPHLKDLKSWSHLSYACSLCAACTATCPVEIDLHQHLLRNRDSAVQNGAGLLERLMFKSFGFAMRRPWLYRLAGRLARPFITLTRPLRHTILDPLARWRTTRDLPAPHRRTFKDYWRARSK